jgi:hypothetical protein
VSSEKLEVLRVVIADESLPIAERKVAAEHAVQVQLSAVPEPDDNDDAVAALRTPSVPINAHPVVVKLTQDSMGFWYELQGWLSTGPTLPQARQHVHKSHKLRLLLRVIVDKAADRLERLAACRVVLDDHIHPRGKFRVNHYGEERLLDLVLPPTATKWAPGGNRPVERPPMGLDDVWYGVAI